MGLSLQVQIRLLLKATEVQILQGFPIPFVRSKTGNKITVDRGRDNTKAEKHVSGADVKGIDYTTTTLPSIGTIGADSALIEEGDDFGFDGGFV